MKNVIYVAGALALLSGSGCRSWCEHHYAPHAAAAPAPCCMPVQQCCPAPAAPVCCPTPAVSNAPGWQRQPQ
jgi:hypothetical protein